MIGFGQQTYVPDDNFETYCENQGWGNGIANDNYVTTTNINTVTNLVIDYESISDLTGIEDFIALTTLRCAENQLTSLDVSQNTALTILWCDNNLLTNLDVRNGNNTNFTEFISTNNPNLTCINVDDVTFSTTNWTDIDSQHYFSANCP